MLTVAGHRVMLGAMVVLAVGAVLVAQVQGGEDADTISATGDPGTTVADVDRSDRSVPMSTLPLDDGAVPTTAAPPTTVTTAATAPTETSIVPGAVGAFTVASGQTEVVGTGSLVTYTVETEDAVGYSADEFARIVDEVLGDPRSWTADGAVAFQRVPSGGQVRVVLATPDTVDQLCLPLQTNGIYSCHQGGTVALNSTRWRNGADGWNGSLDEFRRYAVNHEMGHAIGHGHEYCPGVGQPAPVMMQQSKGLNGCTPNGWPFP